MARTACFCENCGQKLSENHLCLLCQVCNIFLRQDYIATASIVTEVALERLLRVQKYLLDTPSHKSSPARPSRCSTFLFRFCTSSSFTAPPLQKTIAAGGPSRPRRRSASPQLGPSRPRCKTPDVQPGPSRVRPERVCNRASKYGDSDSDAEDTYNDNIVETPHIISRQELFEGVCVRLGFSVPDQDQPDPSDYLRVQEEYLADILQTHRQTLGLPPPAAKAFAGFTLVLTRTDLTTGEAREIEENITLHSYIFTSDDDCRRAVRGWSEEMETRLEDWITDEGSGLDLERITAHTITILRVLVPQAIGSMAFMNGSLSSLAKTHIESGLLLKYSKRLILHLPPEAHSLLLTGKGIFPYEYLDDFKKLEDANLPSIEHFFSSLTGETPAEEHDNVLKVWEAAQCRTLSDYADCYLCVNVGLLADVLIEWRSMLLTKYSLDMVNYVSLPGYAYDAFLKMTKAELELISDPLERSVRGGLTTCVRPYTVANNPLVNPSFDPEKKKRSYLLYLDFNSLYATVTSEKLAYGNIRKFSLNEKTEFVVKDLSEHDGSGNISHWIEADIRIAPDVARKTDDLPFLSTT
ncbi:hypothetical protein C7M84_002645 [Penaeus vannamei]|uniref:DNA-directed DNA polymerase n=1 Tax=Penaeus vannamei TaxID=6689 RepID=A0A423TQD4_PENVA|nr:hypothetical protein C7M84_002645 [Penaeus vannamei]